MILLYHGFQFKKQKEDGKGFCHNFNTCDRKYDFTLHSWSSKISCIATYPIYDQSI